MIGTLFQLAWGCHREFVDAAETPDHNCGTRPADPYNRANEARRFNARLALIPVARCSTPHVRVRLAERFAISRTRSQRDPFSSIDWTMKKNLSTREKRVPLHVLQIDCRSEQCRELYRHVPHHALESPGHSPPSWSFLHGITARFRMGFVHESREMSEYMQVYVELFYEAFFDIRLWVGWGA